MQQKHLMGELEDDYLDADKKFDEMQKKMNVELYSNQDLEKYMKALDQYLLSYKFNGKSDHEISYIENG